MVGERLMPPAVPIALGGAGGPVMDAPEAFGIVYDPIELPTLPPKPAGSASSTSTGTLRTAPSAGSRYWNGCVAADRSCGSQTPMHVG